MFPILPATERHILRIGLNYIYMYAFGMHFFVFYEDSTLK